MAATRDSTTGKVRESRLAARRPGLLPFYHQNQAQQRLEGELRAQAAREADAEEAEAAEEDRRRRQRHPPFAAPSAPGWADGDDGLIRVLVARGMEADDVAATRDSTTGRVRESRLAARRPGLLPFFHQNQAQQKLERALAAAEERGAQRARLEAARHADEAGTRHTRVRLESGVTDRGTSSGRRRRGRSSHHSSRRRRRRHRATSATPSSSSSSSSSRKRRGRRRRRAAAPGEPPGEQPGLDAARQQVEAFDSLWFVVLVLPQ